MVVDARPSLADRYAVCVRSGVACAARMLRQKKYESLSEYARWPAAQPFDLQASLNARWATTAETRLMAKPACMPTF